MAAVERTINESHTGGDAFPSGQTVSNIQDVNSSRDSKNSTFEVRPDPMTLAQINALEPELGRIVYDTDNNVNRAYNGVSWAIFPAEVDPSEVDLSEHIGFVDYNDASTAVTPITLVADTWTDIPNDTLGAFTNTAYLPTGMTGLIDANTGYLDFAELTLGSDILIRLDGRVSPNVNNALFEARYVLGNGGGVYELDSFSKRLDSGSGMEYSTEKGAFYIYMGDLNTKDGVGKIQVRLSSAGTFKSNGVAIKIYKK